MVLTLGFPFKLYSSNGPRITKFIFFFSLSQINKFGDNFNGVAGKSKMGKISKTSNEKSIPMDDR